MRLHLVLDRQPPPRRPRRWPYLLFAGVQLLAAAALIAWLRWR